MDMGENMREEYKQITKLTEENNKLIKENTKLRIALCNLRDEFLDLGGDPKQLELFNPDDLGQLQIFDE